LAKSLIDLTLAKHPELEKYHNLYNDRLAALVQAKIEGKEIAKPPAERAGPPVINIMDALKASLEAKRPRSPGSSKAHGARDRVKTPVKRRKSG
jgi:DNA end-binding protein Ku